jgi:alpha-L-fucosidase
MPRIEPGRIDTYRRAGKKHAHPAVGFSTTGARFSPRFAQKTVYFARFRVEKAVNSTQPAGRRTRPSMLWHLVTVLLAVAVTAAAADDSSSTDSGPTARTATTPVAVPTAAQLAWQDREIGAMITFNMQTYGLLPVATHKHPPPASTFSADQLSTDQWISAAKSFGAKYAVLTATHRSGFALWPTKSHNYSVASSSYRGDVVRDFVASCKKFGLIPGLFWTQRFNDYFGVPNGGLVNASRAVKAVTQAQYDQMMSVQLEELAAYEGIEEIWINGAIEGPAAPQLAAQLARLFPNSTCHSCAGHSYPDGGVPTRNNIRWVGDELAFGPQPSWSAMGVTGLDQGHTGDPRGALYDPPSCDAVLREHCWFGGDAYPPGHCHISSPRNLLRKYLTSVGRNCNLILNIAPDTHGALGAAELDAYRSMGQAVDCMFSKPVAETAGNASLTMDAATRTIEWVLPPTGAPCQNCSLVLMEELEQGQLIGNYSLLCQSECSGAEDGCRVGAEPWKPCVSTARLLVAALRQ